VDVQGGLQCGEGAAGLDEIAGVAGQAGQHTLVTALQVKIDDMLVKDRRPGRPARLSHAELVWLAVAQGQPL
jgi:hypothetical protein